MIKISMKFVPLGAIDNKLALVQVMAWRQTITNADPVPLVIYSTLVKMYKISNTMIYQCFFR